MKMELESTNAVHCTPQDLARPPRTKLLRAVKSAVRAFGISPDDRVLIVGGSAQDEEILRQAGFKNIVNSNIGSDMDRLEGSVSGPGEHLAVDVEEIDLPADSFDVVFASEVLHHCISPQRALCEMVRVCRRYVMFMEPNDSLAMNALVKLRFSFPYELPAVIAHDFRSGGVRDSQIPNFIYRWSWHDVFKTVSSCIPERVFSVRADPYWDFGLSKEDLGLRKETRLGAITSLIGAGNFIALLRTAEFFLNLAPPLRGQGNKFFCCIEKSPNLKPWMLQEGGEIVFNREYGKR
jgi:SAM-dependent methyltransferase